MKTEKITNKFNIEQTLINMTITEMKSVLVNKTNFHDCTVANWIEKDVDFVADYKSGSGSEYMYTKDGIYRKSNHWFMSVNTCVWLLNNKESEKDTVAFCKFEDFKKYSSKRVNGTLSNSFVQLQKNIQNMINGEMVPSHRIGNIIQNHYK